MTVSQGTTVGVVGDPSLTAAVEDVGAAAISGDATDVLAADPDVVVTVGDRALSAVARRGTSVPVLAVDVAPGVPRVARDSVSDAIRAALSGDVPSTKRQRFAASVDGDRLATFFRDAMLITGEPARISEYGVRSGDDKVARFRADGVVVATPAGSPGYLSDAGGPIVEPGTGTLAVAPVAPFRTQRDHWVLDDAGVTLSVHRDESVVLVADGSERGQVPSGTSLDLVPLDALPMLAPGEEQG